MAKKTAKEKNRPVESRQDIHSIDYKTVAHRILAEAKKLERELEITHCWVTSTDGKTRKLVRI
jgi:hypothetical protein